MRNLICVVLVAVILFPAGLYAADFAVFVFDDKGPVENVTVLLDGKKIGRTNIGGALQSPIAKGKHSVVLQKSGKEMVAFDFETREGQNADASITFSLETDPVVAVDTYRVDGKEDIDDPVAKGLLKGVVKSRSSGAPLPNAKLIIERLDLVASTDVFGKYELELPRGVYEILVTHPDQGSRTFSNIEIVAYVVSELDFSIGRQLTIEVPVMEEISVVATYIPEGFKGIALERSASAVTDIIDKEALTRFGGSTAVAALQRVVGISVASDKYIVVRGLNERHTAVTLNGAAIPSPDPSRRVVPLDIFPAAILQSIEVQKSASPDQPVDSTGGTVTLKTKEFPKEFEGDFSFALGYVDGLTGEDRTVQQEESSDFFGFGADDRSLPQEAAILQELVPMGLATQQERIAGALALDPSALANRTMAVDPNIAFEIGIGDALAEFENGVGLSYLLSLDYSNAWSYEDSERRSYINASGQQLVDDFDYARTENNVDLSLGASIGAAWGNHQVSSNTFLLRQSQAETNISTGIQSIERNLQVKTEHRWNEREFFMQQLVGEHDFEESLKTKIIWDFFVANASLDSPDQREIIFRGSSPDNEPDVTLNDIVYFSANRTFVELDDDSTGYDVDLTTTVYEGDYLLAKLKYGVNYFDREREAGTQRFIYQGSATGELRNETRIENVINADTITDGNFQLSTNTQPTDTYTATWEMMAYYLSTELEFGDNWRLLLGARAEDSELIVNTFVDAPGQAIPETAVLDEKEVFSSINVTYLFTEDLQLRASVYETKNRPDFRELANAQFIDPSTGDLFRGNSRLESAEIDNYDLRAEWYLSDSESITLAYFSKDFINAIEKTVRRVGGSGEIFSYANADDGNINGFELDFKKEMDFSQFNMFLSGNLAIIDSEVTLSSGSQTVSRNMQGQPDSLYNIQLGLDEPEAGRQYTLVIYRVGESIDSVSQGLPEIIRQPRSEVDFSFAQFLGVDRKYKLKAKLKNITDSDVELTQGGELYRKYKKGTTLEVGFGLEF